MEDQQAILRLKQGDITALEPLVRNYQTQALHIAYLITRDPALAEDVVQTAFLRVHQRIEQFDVSRPFKPWFFRVVSNDAIKALHGSQRTTSLNAEGDSGWLQAHDDLPEHQLMRAETNEEVWNLLGELSPGQRAVVVLRYYADLKHDEIAETLNVAPPTVRWRLHAALGRLRNLIIKSDQIHREIVS